MIRFEPHSHSDYSNIRLIDCINTPLAVVPIVSYLFLFCKGFLHQRIRPPFPVYV